MHSLFFFKTLYYSIDPDQLASDQSSYCFHPHDAFILKMILHTWMGWKSEIDSIPGLQIRVNNFKFWPPSGAKILKLLFTNFF